MRLFDAHCHLDFMSNMEEVARDGAADGLHVLATTVTPQGYLLAQDALAGLSNVDVAVGAHPWWVADGRLSPADVEAAAALAGTARLVGEVGMDFSPRHVPEGSKDVQRAAFRRICAAAATGSDPARPTVMSIHSVRSVAEVLDVLSTTGCLERCRCVFHWFSGSSDELHAAVVAGCWFSGPAAPPADRDGPTARRGRAVLRRPNRGCTPGVPRGHRGGARVRRGGAGAGGVRQRGAAPRVVQNAAQHCGTGWR